MSTLQHYPSKHKSIIAGVCYDLAKAFHIKTWIVRAFFVILLLKMTIPAIIFYFLLAFILRNTNLLNATLNNCSGDIINSNLAPLIITFSVIVVSLQFSVLMLVS